MDGFRKPGMTMRIIILFAILAGIIGPWVFDKINVPAEYTCSPPNYRLYGDFCGSPLSGGYVVWMTGAEGLRRLFLVASGPVDWDFSFTGLLIGLLMVLILLPLLTTFLLCVRPDRRRMIVFHIVVCALSTIAGLFFALSSYPRLFYVVWGVWLYILATVGAAVLGFLALRTKKASAQDA